jgi:tRNA threonylcarbamoyladenosine biosynthesis protein TsaE
MASIEAISRSTGDTRAIASVLAPLLVAGDVVLFEGGLATGKTAVIKDIAAELCSADVVTSPTFALVHIYRTETAPILHVDAYRLSGVPEFRDLGLEEYIEESITLVEWGDKLAMDFACYLTVSLSVIGGETDHRLVRFSSECGRWIGVLGDIQASLNQIMVAQ